MNTCASANACILPADSNDRTLLCSDFDHGIDNFEMLELMVINPCDINSPRVFEDDTHVVTDEAAISTPVNQ